MISARVTPPLTLWTAVYGKAANQPTQYLGAQKWLKVSADHYFSEPPSSVNTKSGSATRRVLSGLGAEFPDIQINSINSEEQQKNLIAAHMRWDDLNSGNYLYWLYLASQNPDYASIVERRLIESPDNLILLRVQQDAYSDASVCQQQQQIADKYPENPDWLYLSIRCQNDANQDSKFIAAAENWPTHSWLAYAAARIYINNADWVKALQLYDIVALNKQLRVVIAVEMERLKRIVDDNDNSHRDLSQNSYSLQNILAIDEGNNNVQNTPYAAYHIVQSGDFEQAIKISARDQRVNDSVVELVGASVNATKEQIQKALQRV